MDRWFRHVWSSTRLSGPVFWSHVCSLCRERCLGRDLCQRCQAQVNESASRCSRCGLAGFSPTNCPDCAYTEFSFDQTVAGFCHKDHGRALVKQFKFDRRRSVGRVVSSLLLDAITQSDYVEWPEVIIPVPAHPLSRLVRGFSPVDDIAHDLSKALRIPVVQPFQAAYQRRPQRELSKSERFGQVSKKYTSRELSNLGWRYVVLVDDVMTTGATLSALSDQLRVLNVQKIHCWVASRTPFVE